MILVDTSVWIGHLRTADEMLAKLLHAGEVLGHPFVLGELALGNLRQRGIVLQAVAGLPPAKVATDTEVLHLIEHRALFARGIGYIDAHLLTAVALTPGAELWTSDKKLHDAAVRLELASTRALQSR